MEYTENYQEALEAKYAEMFDRAIEQADKYIDKLETIIGNNSLVCGTERLALNKTIVITLLHIYEMNNTLIQSLLENFSNKIIEPTEENRVYISRFESEYNSNYKFLTFLNKKLLIRGTNDKIYNFSIAKENHHTSSEIKLLQLELLLNNLFSRYKDTYQQKVKFNTNIKYFITKAKINKCDHSN